MFQRVKAGFKAMDRGISNWSQEFWCKTMKKVIYNHQKEMKADDKKKINQ